MVPKTEPRQQFKNLFIGYVFGLNVKGEALLSKLIPNTSSLNILHAHEMATNWVPIGYASKALTHIQTTVGILMLNTVVMAAHSCHSPGIFLNGVLLSDKSGLFGGFAANEGPSPVSPVFGCLRRRSFPFRGTVSSERMMGAHLTQ